MMEPFPVERFARQRVLDRQDFWDNPAMLAAPDEGHAPRAMVRRETMGVLRVREVWSPLKWIGVRFFVDEEGNWTIRVGDGPRRRWR